MFLTPGILATAAMNSASFETTFGSFTRMHEQNTYAAILATPCSVADIVAGDMLWAATKSVLAVSFVLIVTGVAGLLPSWLAVGTLPVAFLIGLTFAALGMIVTARAGSYDFFDYYFTLGISVMVFFCGVFFPLASLPAVGAGGGMVPAADARRPAEPRARRGRPERGAGGRRRVARDRGGRGLRRRRTTRPAAPHSVTAVIRPG